MTPDWLGAARRAAQALSAMLAEQPDDRASAWWRPASAARAATARWRSTPPPSAPCSPSWSACTTSGARFTVVSEERGTVDYGGDGTLVIVDPIDGSMNAKRGMTHHALSIAVAEGPTMADVVFGYVYDLGPGEEWVAERGAGARARRRARSTPRSASAARATASSSSSGSSRPTRAGCATPPTRSWSTSHRLRAMGTIAVTLCQVAGARLDGMTTLRRCRAVDAAAGQLIVREAGGHVAFTACDDAARRAAGPRAALARGRRAHARGPARARAALRRATNGA